MPLNPREDVTTGKFHQIAYPHAAGALMGCRFDLESGFRDNFPHGGLDLGLTDSLFGFQIAFRF